MADNTRSDNLTKAFKFGATKAIQQIVYTSTPGVVSKYDPATKRAVIQPAIMRAFAARESVPMAPLVDVPIVQPATGGYMIHQQVNAGDIVLIHFTKEGMDAFKVKWAANVEPTRGKLFSDAFATLVGRNDVEPVSSEGVCIQSEDGNASIVLKRDSIEMRVGRGRARLTTSNFDTWRA